MKMSHCFIFLVFLVTVHIIRACLPMNDLFKNSLTWQQGISVPDRILYYIEVDSEKEIIKVKNEGGDQLALYKCLESYGEYRHMMSVYKPGEDIRYQCIKFKSLTAQVIRIAKSSYSDFKNRLNCRHAVYTEDPAVLIDYFDIPSQPCRLQGGFQMRLRETQVPDSEPCVTRGWQENPSIHFECGPSQYVVAQFGRYCTPKVLNDAQKMRRRYLTHLNCVSSWEEEGKGKFILLRMRDMYTTFWCLNYVANENGDILSVYLTFDGRCTKKPESSDPASRHGHLISYVPSSDPRCNDISPRKCEFFNGDCSKTNECPRQCHRCVPKKMKKSRCRFMLDTAGHWYTGSPSREKFKFQLDVDMSNFTMSDQGGFECTGEAERSMPGRVYPVVQYSSYSTCLPYHACSQMVSPAPGFLNFFLRPAATDEGRVLTCAETHEKFGYVIPVDKEKEFTLVKPSAMQQRSCNIMKRMTFPTDIKNCRFAIEKCSGSCDTLEVGPDVATCGNSTDRHIKLETRHRCLARLPFDGGHRGIITKSIPGGRFFCWIFTKDKDLKITKAHKCNSQSVKHLLKYYLQKYRNDPLYALEDEKYSVESGSYANSIVPNLKWIVLQALLVLLSMPALGNVDSL